MCHCNDWSMNDRTFERRELFKGSLQETSLDKFFLASDLLTDVERSLVAAPASNSFFFILLASFHASFVYSFGNLSFGLGFSCP